MKKALRSALYVLLLLLVMMCVVACNEEEHTHTFRVEKIEEQYLAAKATCTSPATYYYSCTCGEKGTETFSYGDPLGHSFTDYRPDGNATCTKTAPRPRSATAVTRPIS